MGKKNLTPSVNRRRLRLCGSKIEYNCVYTHTPHLMPLTDADVTEHCNVRVCVIWLLHLGW